MRKELEDVINKLTQSVMESDFLNIAEEQIELLEELDQVGEAITPLLKLLEGHPNVDFGMPGPIVHFVEKFYRSGYEGKLVESIKRSPTPHTIWMLNRIINGSEGDVREFYMAELEKIATSDRFGDDLKEVAREFLS